MPDNVKIEKPPVPVKQKPKPIEQKPIPKPVEPKPTPKPIEPKPAADPIVPLSEAGKLMQEAFADIQKSDYISARVKLNEVMRKDITPQERARIKKALADLSKIWLFSKVALPGDELSGSYLVQSGDNLTAIGNRYNVPPEFLMKVNGIKDAKRLRAGQNLKVVNGPFNAIIYKSTFEMDLYLQNTYVKTYNVGVGQVGKDTPTGTWRVKSDGKLIRPPWPRPQDQGGGLVQPDDPEYPLGSRWIGLDGIGGDAKGRTGFGIHGTRDPESIGTRSSLGCVRLYNGEVIEVYDMMMHGLSEIHIRD
jgi:lipoprotein-anchoring transpeptidase ErfK/SrfK